MEYLLPIFKLTEIEIKTLILRSNNEGYLHKFDSLNAQCNFNSVSVYQVSIHQSLSRS